MILVADTSDASDTCARLCYELIENISQIAIHYCGHSKPKHIPIILVYAVGLAIHVERKILHRSHHVQQDESRTQFLLSVLEIATDVWNFADLIRQQLMTSET